MNQELQQFAQEAIERFKEQDSFMYMGDLECPPWGLLGFVGTNRDADALSRSNFEVITKDLLEKHPDSFVVEEYSHWLVGWVKGVRINTSDAKAVETAYKWSEDMENYPVADEDHFTQTEMEEDEEYYRLGGREEIIEIARNSEDLSEIFSESGELLEEYEDFINRAFHNAMSEGDHTALPPDSYVLNALHETWQYS